MADILPVRPERLTIISAPAGYGKTSFAGQWFRALREHGQCAAWVSLEPEDRDPFNLLQHIVGALDHALQAQRRADILDSLSVASLLQILRRMLTGTRHDLVLFLDDYHVAQTDQAEAAVFKLCSEAALDRLRLVLISRGRPGFPLARLRVEGKVRHLGVDQLRFSVGEARRLFGMIPDEPDSNDWICGLLGRTEGWAVALQMARVLSSEVATDHDFWQDFTGHSEDMGGYLIEQVFSKLPGPVCRFLYMTAELPVVSAELAAAATEDPAARELFDNLSGLGLPIFVQDPAAQWVRYHPLLRSFLRNEAARQGIDVNLALARAAAWFHARGDIKSAVRHALLCGDADLAMRIVEAEGGWQLVYLTSRGGMSIFRQLSESVGNASLERYPLTALGLAVLHAKTGQLQSAHHYLQRARESGASCAGMERHDRLVHALISLYDDSYLSPAELTALEHDLGSDEDLGLVHRGLLLNLLSFNYLNQGRHQQSIAYGEQSLRCLKDCGAGFGALHLHIHIGQARYLTGDSVGAEANYTRLIEDAQAHFGPASDMNAIGVVLLSELEVQRGDYQGISERLGRALSHVENNDTWFDILAAGLVTRLRIALMDGRCGEAHQAIDEARTAAGRRGLKRLRDLCRTERVRVLIAEGDLREAQRFAELNRIGSDKAFDRRSNSLSHQLRGQVPSMLWARIWLAQGLTDKAHAALDWLLAMQAERLTVPRFVELQTLAIRIALAEGNLSMAAERLTDFAFGAPVAGYRATILEEGVEVGANFLELGAHAEVTESARSRIHYILGQGAPRASGAACALTRRERDILGLLPSGGTNKEIGRQLGMSDNTVKFHLRNLFAKLGASTRTGAVSAARVIGAVD